MRCLLLLHLTPTVRGITTFFLAFDVVANNSSTIEKKSVISSHLSTPASFRSDLASRPVTGSLLRLPKRSRNSSPQRNFMPMQVEKFGPPDTRSHSYRGERELPRDQAMSTAQSLSEELTDSQRDYAASLQYNAHPYATPSKPSAVFPQIRQFEYDSYAHQSPLPSERIGLNRRSFQPPSSPAMQPRPPQSSYFASDQSRIHAARSAVVSASGARDFPIAGPPRGYLRRSQQQYYPHGAERTNAIIRDRNQHVGPVRSDAEPPSEFVAGLAMRGGRQL
jgi:hypothetical protein